MTDLYKPSNTVSAASLIAIPFVAAVVSVLLSAPYALLLVKNPFIYFSVLATLLWAYISAKAAGLAIGVCKNRNPLVSGFLCLLGGLVGFYCHWVVWIMIITGGSGSDVPAALANPLEMFDLAKLICERGAWTLKGKPVKGNLLMGIWVVEFIAYAVVLYLSSSSRAARPFDENAGKWYIVHPYKKLFALPEDGNLDALQERFRANDFSYLTAAPVPADERMPHFSARIYLSDYSPDAYIDVALNTFEGKKNEKKEHELLNLAQISAVQAQTIISR
jgi:hypothetical protein